MEKSGIRVIGALVRERGLNIVAMWTTLDSVANRGAREGSISIGEQDGYTRNRTIQAIVL